MSSSARQTDPHPAEEIRAGPTRIRRTAQLDEQKRSFLRMVSHELRTPLNAVIGFSEIVSSELYGPLGAPQYKEYAELIRQSGYKMLKLVNQIVDIAKLEGQAMELSLEVEPLDSAVDDALGLVRQEIKDRNLTVVVENEGSLPLVWADGRGLRTMLVNLLQNAVCYSPEGGTVTIRTRRHGVQVDLEIADQGEGIAAEDIPRLMRPFEQGENALTRSSQGAGLGLPIVALLSQAMGGSLRLRSAPGEGLTAVICLPAA
jgi:signal transduction histidine kinase